MLRPSSEIKPLHRLPGLRLALLAVVAIAAFAVPSSALAAGPTLVGSLPMSFNAKGVGSVLISESTGAKWECSSSSATGSFTSGSAGTETVTLQGCKYGGLGSCQSAGQASGTIVTSTLNIQPVFLNSAHTTFGLLLSPASGNVAEFQCGIAKSFWSGSVIGQLQPGLGVSTLQNEFSLRELSSGVQQYTQIEGTGPVHQLYHGTVTVALNLTQTMEYPSSIKWQG